jgi:hypothetical protein
VAFVFGQLLRTQSGWLHAGRSLCSRPSRDHVIVTCRNIRGPETRVVSVLSVGFQEGRKDGGERASTPYELCPRNPKSGIAEFQGRLYYGRGLRASPKQATIGASVPDLSVLWTFRARHPQ